MGRTRQERPRPLYYGQSGGMDGTTMDDEQLEELRKAGGDYTRSLLAPRPGAINWRGPNWWTFTLFVAAFTLANLKPGNAVRDFVFDRNVIGAFFGGISGVVRITIRLYANRIEDFEPRTALEAKRANEQIKSLSTAINTLAAGSAVAVTVRQISELKPDYPLMILAVGLAVWIHTGARHLLGLLKDESISATSPAEEAAPEIRP